MNYLVTAIVFILIFSILILVHEFGHFITAKRSGIKVIEFGFGLPPRIWGKKVGDTLYSINWIPFGGFVKLFGEDSFNPRVLKDERSFASKKMRTRVKVIVAGVLMNFLLAWVLLATGFTVGMQPLLTPDEVFTAVSSGVIKLEEGVKIKEEDPAGPFAMAGIKADDIIYSVNGKIADEDVVKSFLKNPSGIYKIIRDSKFYSYEITDTLPDNNLKLYDFVPFPRVKIFSLDTASNTYKYGLRTGDVILSVNGDQVYSVQDFENSTRGISTLDYTIYRDGFRGNFVVELNQARNVIISDIIPDKPAYKAGLQAGDVILSVNAKKMDDSEVLITFIKEHKNEKSAYLIERDGQKMFFEIQPGENGEMGMYLTELMTYGSDSGMSLYNVGVVSSVTEIKDAKYPWYIAIYKSFGEGFRLAKLTGGMFLGFIGDFVRGGGVPDNISGPVGIARLTYTFVQEGFISVLRFVAILSLSLAVINILPIPALDGGRLLFIFIEFVIGRRINQRWESYIHALGYMLLLLLILAVTYNDVVKIIFG